MECFNVEEEVELLRSATAVKPPPLSFTAADVVTERPPASPTPDEDRLLPSFASPGEIPSRLFRYFAISSIFSESRSPSDEEAV